MFDILGRKKRYDNETLSIDGVSDKNIFIEKSYRKCAAKADLFIISVNNPKQPLHARIFLTARYFERGLSKSPKIGNLISSFEPSPLQ